jgi:hypothetical protein
VRLGRATGRSPHTWSSRSQVRWPASGSPECSPRRHFGKEHAPSPGSSRCNSDAARARPLVERAARLDAQTARQLRRVLRQGESRTAQRSLAWSCMSHAESKLRSRCPVRRSSDLLVQLTNLALNTSHRVVSRHLGLAQLVYCGEKTPSSGFLQLGLTRCRRRTRFAPRPTITFPRRFDHFYQPPARKREDAGASPGSSSCETA